MDHKIIPLFGLIFVLFACFSSGGTNTGNSTNSSAIEELTCNLTNAAPTPTANSWAYWLADIDINELTGTSFDLLVIDYASDGSEDTEFTAQEITTLKNSGKTVLAYMSIGEAEVDRFYWDASWIDNNGTVTNAAPDWLAESNPNFPDNYEVRYWEADWQNIIFGTTAGANKSYLDRIIDAGFNGVYLDIIDAYEYFGPNGEEPENDNAGEDMITFVRAIADYARNTRGVSDFMVFPQNGAMILDEESACDYLNDINGLGAEDTFYYGDEDNNNDLDLDNIDTITPYLNTFVSHDKLVLAIDYVQEADKVDDFYERAQNLGYLPYASVRELNTLTINTGHDP